MIAGDSKQDRSARIVRNATALALSKVLTSAMLVAWQIALARALGAAEYGVYGTIGAMMALGATIPDPGIGVIVVRDVARRPEEAGRYLGAALALHAGLAVLGYVVLQIGAALLGYEADLRALVAFVGINLLVDAIGTAAHNQFTAAERMGWTSLVGIGHVTMLVGTGMLALVAGGGLWAVYTAVLVAGVVRAMVYWAGLVGHGWRPLFPIDRIAARHLVTAGFPLGMAAFLSLGFMHADKLVTTAVLGTAGTGQLTAAFVIVYGLVELLGTTMLVAAYPVMARGPDGGRGGAVDPLLHHLLFFDLLIGLPTAMLLVFFARDMSAIVFGAGFEGAGTVLRVMGWYIVVRMVEGVLAQALTVANRQTSVLATRTIGLVVNLAVTIVLLPRVGLVGAALGMVVGELAIVACMLCVLSPSLEWWARMGGRVARLAPAALGLWGSALALGDRLPAPAAASVALIVYGGLAVGAGAITRDQRHLLLRVARETPAAMLARWLRS